MTDDDRAELLELVRDLRSTLESEAASGALPEAPALEPARPESPAAPEPPPRPAPGASPPGPPAAPTSGGDDALSPVRQELGECQRCALHDSRAHLVFGVGSPTADLVFVGEAPGFEEDRQGEPFVGPAGGMLTNMIHNVLRLQREDVYIANVLKCRPPRNRNPEPGEIAMCSPFLERQLDALQPRLIVALGRFAAQYLLDSTDGVGRLRGRVHPRRRNGCPVVVTYHPAYLLRNPEDKRKAMDDLMLIRSALEEATGTPLPPVRRPGRR